ncbi:hypothetical protein [Rhizohabitans arisaemae]|uniref:hypothetical protein n=1 Tax=Rhizohabitans arisaemae TaxID=2720610 RepID=UPI0024B080CC|nr:hypothetical protein [Rhizohabitans arisaemae]
MRAQEPGSGHDNQGGEGPATPPPSFGHPPYPGPPTESVASEPSHRAGEPAGPPRPGHEPSPAGPPAGSPAPSDWTPPEGHGDVYDWFESLPPDEEPPRSNRPRPGELGTPVWPPRADGEPEQGPPTDPALQPYVHQPSPAPALPPEPPPVPAPMEPTAHSPIIAGPPAAPDPGPPPPDAPAPAPHPPVSGSGRPQSPGPTGPEPVIPGPPQSGPVAEHFTMPPPPSGTEPGAPGLPNADASHQVPGPQTPPDPVEPTPPAPEPAAPIAFTSPVPPTPTEPRPQQPGPPPTQPFDAFSRTTAVPALPEPPSGETRRAASSRKKLVVWAGTAGVVMIAAASVIFAVRATQENTPPRAQPRPTLDAVPPLPTTEPPSPAPVEPSPIPTDRVDSERTDAKSLALTEVFPEKQITIAGRAFTRVQTQVDEDCGKAAMGPFAKALTQQKCRRVVRATYVDKRQRYAVTTGIAVLPTKEAAIRADRAKNLKSNLWFRGLPNPDDPAATRVNIAGGYAAGMVWGRYIVFAYATYSDGHTPSPTEQDLGPVSSAFRDYTATPIEKRITG